MCKTILFSLNTIMTRNQPVKFFAMTCEKTHNRKQKHVTTMHRKCKPYKRNCAKS